MRAVFMAAFHARPSKIQINDRCRLLERCARLFYVRRPGTAEQRKLHGGLARGVRHDGQFVFGAWHLERGAVLVDDAAIAIRLPAGIVGSQMTLDGRQLERQIEWTRASDASQRRDDPVAPALTVQGSEQGVAIGRSELHRGWSSRAAQQPVEQRHCAPRVDAIDRDLVAAGRLAQGDNRWCSGVPQRDAFGAHSSLPLWRVRD